LPASDRATERYSVYLIEGGFPPGLPGFTRDLPSASFPFWGGHCFLDFATANFRGLGERPPTLVAEDRFRAMLPQLASRAEEAAQRIVFLDEGLAGLQTLLERDPADAILLCPLSLACLLDREALQEQMRHREAEIVKLSVGGAAADVYLARRTALTQALATYLSRNPAAVELAAGLFGDVLHHCFEAMEEVPGHLYFQNSLMQLYRENLRVALNTDDPEVTEPLGKLQECRAPRREIVVERSAEVRNSLLAPGSRVEGRVEGSFIFPDVVVHRGAMVSNSVVMNGNRVGARSQLHRCLVLPYLGDNGKNAPNIGESSSIGLKASTAINYDYPQQIRDGITVLGVSVEVPKSYTIGAGCLVGARVSAEQLRPLKELRKGASVLCSTDR
jgi:hypothetical protein